MRSVSLQSDQALQSDFPSTSPQSQQTRGVDPMMFSCWPLLKMLCQHLNSIGSISCQQVLMVRNSTVCVCVGGGGCSFVHTTLNTYPATTMRRPDAYTMLGRCHRQWANIKLRCESGRYVLASTGH